MPGAHDDRRDAKGPGPRRRKPRHGQATIRRARPRALRRAVRAPHAGHEVLRDARPHGGHRAARGHLAGRRAPRHEHVPRRGLRRADDARRRSTTPRARSSTGRPRASIEVKDPIAQVMAAEGMEVEPDDLLVTTGGQQVIDLVCKTLIDPGDVVIAEAPTYPGAVPVFVSYQADVVQIEMDHDGMRIDVLEAELERLDAEGRIAEVHLHRAVVPEPGRRDAVARAAPAPGRDRAAARAARARGQPVRHAALRGRAAADAVLARRRRVRDLPRHVLEDPLAGAAASAGPRRRGRCSTSSTSARARPTCARRRCRSCSCAPYFAERDWRATCATLTGLYRRRRDIMLEALAEHFPREATWTRPQGGLFIWARLPSTSTRPTSWRGRCATTWRSCPGGPRTWTDGAAPRCG